MMKKYIIFVLIAIPLILTFGCSHLENREVPDDAFSVPMVEAKVNKITDGDTLHVQLNGEDVKVRIIGVDCPEIGEKAEDYGEEAKQYVQSLLENQTVWLESDKGDEDRYGRKLRYVWLEKPQIIDEESIRQNMLNALLLNEGLADVMSIKPNTRYEEFFYTLESIAKENKKRIWAH